MSAAIDLGGRVVALSTSPPFDLGRLGFPESEFDRAIFDLCLRIVRAGGRVLYGGYLREGSLTAQMYDYVAKAYATPVAASAAPRPKPFLHLLPLSEFRRADFATLIKSQTHFGSFVETRLVTAADRHTTLRRRAGALLACETDGAETKIAGPAELQSFADALPGIDEPAALTAMRAAASRLVAGRVAIGGKRGDLGVAGVPGDKFAGAMPGIYQETLSSLEDGVPTVVLGAYGGAARDVAIDLGLLEAAKETPYLGDIQAGYAEARAKMRALRPKIAAADRAALSDFALREDSETLARDVVAWIARKAGA